MAFGTPTIGTLAYSAAGGTSVAPSYPASIAAEDVLILIIGMKPSTANSGSVTTPTGWTLRESITGQGGYGATLGADTGNTNLFVYTKDSVTGSETGTLSVTVATNNVCWGGIVRIPSGGSTSFSVGSADGTRDTAPTANVAFTVNLTNGGTATDFQSGDMAVWAMCIPTDVTTPSQFSAQSITATGTTFGTAAELSEPDSGTGNDIGGYIAYASATAGSSTAAPSVTVTATGTVTNVRGPVVLLRIRDTTQAITAPLYTNTNTFYAPTVTVGAASIAPSLFTNGQTFYGPTINQTGGGQAIDPALLVNTQTFYSATLTASAGISPALYSNSQTFYGASITTGAVTLAPSLYTNSQTFFAPTISVGGATIAPTLFTNDNTLYGPVISVGGGPQVIGVNLFENSQTFYAPSLTAAYSIEFENYSDPNYVDSNYTGPPVGSGQTFYGATIGGSYGVSAPLVTNSQTFYGPTIAQASPQSITPSLFTNESVFFAAAISDGSTPVITTGSIVRPRRGFRPSILIDFEDDASASTALASQELIAEVGAVVARSPDPVNARASLGFTQIEAYYAPAIRARTGWNDPSDEELALILDFALD